MINTDYQKEIPHLFVGYFKFGGVSVHQGKFKEKCEFNFALLQLNLHLAIHVNFYLTLSPVYKEGTY